CRRRHHARKDGMPARRDNAACEGLLELGPRRARITSDEDPTAARPVRRRTTEAFDEVWGQVFADDASHAVGAEEPPPDGSSVRGLIATLGRRHHAAKVSTGAFRAFKAGPGLGATRSGGQHDTAGEHTTRAAE